MIVPVMAISNLVLTRQIYSEQTNSVHAHNHDRVPLTCPMGISAVFWEIQITEGLLSILPIKRVLGLVKMTCGLVHTSYSLPKWQAIKLAFFAACQLLYD